MYTAFYSEENTIHTTLLRYEMSYAIYFSYHALSFQYDLPPTGYTLRQRSSRQTSFLSWREAHAFHCYAMTGTGA